MLSVSHSSFPMLLLAFAFAACVPQTESTTDEDEPGVTVVTDVVYARKHGMALTFDLYRPEHPNGGAVLFVSSGGFVSGQAYQYERDGWGDYRYLEADQLHLVGDPTPIPLFEQFSFTPLLEAGLTVLDVRHGSSPMYQLPDIVEDLERAVEFVHRNAADLEIETDRIGVWGASSGGYLALYLALAARSADDDGPIPVGNSGISAAAVYYPAGFDLASDAERFPEVIQSLPALQIDRAILDSLSLKHHVRRAAPPTLIVYGTEDFPIITGPSEAVCAGLTAVGAECRLVAFPGTGHEFRGPEGYQSEYGRQALAEVVEWFENWIGPGGEGPY